MNDILAPPPYSPDKFVDREDELKLLDEVVETGEKRAIVFTGERGVGKSWLPAHWERRLRHRGDLLVFQLDLKDYVDKEPGWAVADIIRRISEKTGRRQEYLGADLNEMSRALLQHIRTLKKTFILILDHVYESRWDLLDLMEDYLLASLIAEPGVFIVLTGRGRLYPWKTPDLTFRAAEVRVDPFPNEQATREQLEKQAQRSLRLAERIHRLTEGNPLANYLLAAEPQPAQVSDAVMDAVLATVPEERRQKVQQYVEALCVLRAFDEDRISEMLAVYTGDDSYRRWTFAQARPVRDELVRWALAQWDSKERAYVLDRIVRRLAELHLQQNDPDRWAALHRAASQLYNRWAEENPSTASRWQEEQRYHQDALRRKEEKER